MTSVTDSTAGGDPTLATDLTCWTDTFLTNFNADFAQFDSASGAAATAASSANAAPGVDAASVDPGGVTAAASNPAQQYETEFYDRVAVAGTIVTETPAAPSGSYGVDHRGRAIVACLRTAEVPEIARTPNRPVAEGNRWPGAPGFRLT